MGDIEYTRAFNDYIVKTDLDYYYKAILHESGVYEGNYKWDGDGAEGFMRAYRKMHFNPNTDVRVLLFEEWVDDVTKLDVTVEGTLNGLLEEQYLIDPSFTRTGGVDDLLVYSYIDTTTTPHVKVYSVITDEYKGGVGSIDGLIIAGAEADRKTKYTHFDLN
ncbi:unnamed protein product, partial [marine sediment metagenome]